MEALRALVLILARFCSLLSARSLAALTLFWVCLYLEDVEEERLKKGSNSSCDSILGKVQCRNLFSLFDLPFVSANLKSIQNTSYLCLGGQGEQPLLKGSRRHV